MVTTFRCSTRTIKSCSRYQWRLSNCGGVEVVQQFLRCTVHRIVSGFHSIEWRGNFGWIGLWLLSSTIYIFLFLTIQFIAQLETSSPGHKIHNLWEWELANNFTHCDYLYDLSFTWTAKCNVRGWIWLYEICKFRWNQKCVRLWVLHTAICFFIHSLSLSPSISSSYANLYLLVG